MLEHYLVNAVVLKFVSIAQKWNKNEFCWKTET